MAVGKTSTPSVTAVLGWVLGSIIVIAVLLRVTRKRTPTPSASLPYGGLDEAEFMSDLHTVSVDESPDESVDCNQPGQQPDDPGVAPENSCAYTPSVAGKCERGYGYDQPQNCCYVPSFMQDQTGALIGSIVSEVVLVELGTFAARKGAPAVLAWAAASEMTEEATEAAIEKAAKRSMGKKASKRLAKSMSKVTKSLARQNFVVKRGATKMASKLMGPIVRKMAARVALKAATGIAKMASPLIVFDMVSLILDLGDPSGYNNFTENDMLQKQFKHIMVGAEEEANKLNVDFPQTFPIAKAYTELYNVYVTPALQEAFIQRALAKFTDDEVADLTLAFVTCDGLPPAVVESLAANLVAVMREHHLERDQVVHDTLVANGVDQAQLVNATWVSTPTRMGVTLSKEGVRAYNLSKRSEWFEWNDIFDESVKHPDSSYVAPPVALFASKYVVRDRSNPGTKEAPNVVRKDFQEPIAIALFGGHLVSYCEAHRNAQFLGGLLGNIDDMSSGITPSEYGVYFGDGTGEHGRVGCVYTDQYCTRMGLKHSYNHDSGDTECNMDGGQVVSEAVFGTTVTRGIYRAAHSALGFTCDVACDPLEYCEGSTCNPKLDLGKHVGITAWWKCKSGHEKDAHCVECNENVHCDGKKSTRDGLDCESTSSCFCDGGKCHSKLKLGEDCGQLGEWKCEKGFTDGGVSALGWVAMGAATVATGGTAAVVVGATLAAQRPKCADCGRNEDCDEGHFCDGGDVTRASDSATVHTKVCHPKLKTGEQCGPIGWWKCLGGHDHDFKCADCSDDRHCGPGEVCGILDGQTDAAGGAIPNSTKRCLPHVGEGEQCASDDHCSGGGGSRSCAKYRGGPSTEGGDASYTCCPSKVGGSYWAGAPWLCGGLADEKACDSNLQCGGDSFCAKDKEGKNGVCTPLLKPGEECVDNASCEKDQPGGTHKSCAKVVDEADAPTKCCRGNEGHTWAGGPWLCAGQEGGEACSYNQQCEGDQRCKNGTCQPLAMPGEECVDNTSCEKDIAGITHKSCAKVVDEADAPTKCCRGNEGHTWAGGPWLCAGQEGGDTCSYNQQCGTESRCDAGTCKPKVAKGYACAERSDCVSGSQCAYGAASHICCHNDTCNGVGCGNGGGWCKDHTEGQVCKDDGMCADKHHCKGGVCTETLADGNTCGDSNDCTSGNCSCGVCGGCGTLGQNCEGGRCGAPDDCVGKWGADTGPCNDRKATYKVSTHARYGGAGCPHHHGEVRSSWTKCPVGYPCGGNDGCEAGLVCHWGTCHGQCGSGLCGVSQVQDSCTANSQCESNDCWHSRCVPPRYSRAGISGRDGIIDKNGTGQICYADDQCRSGKCADWWGAAERRFCIT